jgi:hypothetical protein
LEFEKPDLARAERFLVDSGSRWPTARRRRWSPKVMEKLTALLPPATKWRLFFRRQARNPGRVYGGGARRDPDAPLHGSPARFVERPSPRGYLDATVERQPAAQVEVEVEAVAAAAEAAQKEARFRCDRSADTAGSCRSRAGGRCR